MLKKKQKILNCIKILCTFFITVILIKTFVIDIKKVKGNSMLPTLKSGQIVIIFKIAYGIKQPCKNKYLFRWASPEVNDIVIYRKNNHFAVKRVVGNSSSAVEFYSSFYYNKTQVDSENKAFYGMILGDRQINLDAVQFRKLGGFTQKENQKVPKHTVLALGDNLKESYDSRDYGFVNIDSIYAKVLLWK